MPLVRNKVTTLVVMNVSSILHEALARDIKLAHGLDLTPLLKRDNVTLKALDHKLVRVLDEYGSRDWLYRDYPTVFRISEDASLLRRVRTFFNYTYKVKVEPSKDQINEALNKFLERNATCADWNKRTAKIRRHRYTRPTSEEESGLFDLLAVSRYLCYRRLAAYRTPGKPSHGPGTSSNAGSRRIDKYLSIARDVPSSLRRFAEWFVPSPSYVSEFSPLGWDSVCKLSAVSKDARGPRLIAPHSAAHMWMQQAVSDKVCNLLVKQEQWYKYHPLLNEQVSTIQFNDQLVNGALALFGSSRPGLYGTLDLSDASDRIPLGLVSAIMPPRLLRDLVAVRARYIKLPNGTTEKLHMHAPMGSACCFPVLSVVAWSVSCAAIWLKDHTTSTLRDSIPSEFDYVWVFGDDIVIHPDHLPTVEAAFKSVNLSVNVKKSFCGPGGFRESCGVDAYGCEDATPVRLRVGGVSSATDILTLIAHANALREEGLNCTAKVCRDLIEIAADEIGCRHLIGATDDPLYRSSCLILEPDQAKAWNRHGGVRMRKNKKLQRSEIRVLGFKDSYSNVDPCLDSRSRLFEGVLGNRARPFSGWAGNRPRARVVKVPVWYA